MRLAEGLMRSSGTTVGKNQLPSQADRDLCASCAMRSIDHVNEPIIGGHAGKGRPLQLEVRDDESAIAGDGETHIVVHAQFGEWVKTLHTLAVELTNRPQDWIRN
jgi:hypothetical protein